MRFAMATSHWHGSQLPRLCYPFLKRGENNPPGGKPAPHMALWSADHALGELCLPNYHSFPNLMGQLAAFLEARTSSLYHQTGSVLQCTVGHRRVSRRASRTVYSYSKNFQLERRQTNRTYRKVERVTNLNSLKCHYHRCHPLSP